MKNIKFFSLMLMIALFVPFAASFTYDVEPIVNTIQADEAAVFKLVVNNDLDVEDFFTVSTRDVNWVLTSLPASSAVGPKQDVIFTLELAPKSTLSEGNIYFVNIKVKSEKTGTFRENSKDFGIFLGIAGNKTYVPTVAPTIFMDKVVDPREPVSVRISLKNKNQRELKDVNVILKGGSEIERSYSTNLLPLEEKVNEILFRIDPYTLPGKRTLALSLVFDNATIAESSAEYEILGYSDMQEKSSKISGFFKEDNTFEIYNNGNENGIAEHKFMFGFFKRIFSRFEPEAVSTKDGAITFYSVKKEIGPKETFIVQSTTDYRLLVAIIVLIIISTILYFVFRSPVIIYKSAEPLGKITHEGLSEVKVRIYLKNRSNKQIANIRVTDVIPTIAEIKKTTHVGSMDPINLSKGKKGTLARWEFASLEPYEERVIAYRIESKLKLVGGIRLPSAKARFEAKKGSERVTYSNHVNLIHKFEEHQEEPAPERKKK